MHDIYSRQELFDLIENRMEFRKEDTLLLKVAPRYKREAAIKKKYIIDFKEAPLKHNKKVRKSNKT